MTLAAACGGGDDNPDDSDSPGASPSVDTTITPVLAMPVSRFALSLDDLPEGYLTDRESTFSLDSENYGATAIFPSAEEGQEALEAWGYLGGYETAFEPDQRMTAALDGAYYAAVEVHLFKDNEGAAGAQSYFEEQLAAGSDRINASDLGNSSSAWKVSRGTIGSSSIPAVYHRVVFRRGNMVGVVQTYGSEVLLNIDAAWGLALTVDEKTLGTRPAVTPTPLGEAGTPTPTP